MTYREIVEQLKERYEDAYRERAPGHWLFEVSTGDGRSQVVHLVYKERRLEEQDLSRFIVETPIGPIRRRYDYEQFLRQNAELDVGALCIRDLRNEENLPVPYFILRATHLASTADIEEIEEMIEMVARTADGIEKDLYARDLH